MKRGCDGDKLKIALVSDFFCPNTGGIETHIYYLAGCLRASGHEVVVITHSYGKRRGIRELSNKIKVYYLPTIVIFQSTSLASVCGTLYWFRKIFLKEHIQVVHGHSSFSSLAHEAMLHAWCMGLPTVFTDHSLYGFADASAILINKLLIRYSFTNISRIICVSHICKENTVLRAGLPPNRVFVIPNAITTDLFTPDAELFYSNPITVVVLCRLMYRKGADLLVDIIPEVCRRHSTVRFLIGGDGPKRVELEEMREKFKLHNRVIMLGVLPHDKVRDTLIQGQIFLNTSLTEAFCMSIVEAASCGLYVVSTKVGGIPEVLPESYATLTEPNPADLCVAVLDAIRLHENGLLMSPIDKHAKVCDMYRWSNVTERTERVYRTALADPPVPVSRRLKNYISAGFWFGLIWVWAAIMNLLMLSFFDLIDKRSHYEEPIAPKNKRSRAK
ncbi:PIGA (GPI anchor biosynthesis) domain-containing protein [Ditylenchus destructor]|uniref:PIGA (GPI anchor biosynthesis) domain-containing protein n=1 Tax=Ditylenchus destructor TaxID=166010 RepID=A0AAD4MIC3_9BILA|nr:PIGA (GPI anchor biosynthesis) domain-containing protein [Ditylenchus destructor]